MKTEMKQVCHCGHTGEGDCTQHHDLKRIQSQKFRTGLGRCKVLGCNCSSFRQPDPVKSVSTRKSSGIWWEVKDKVKKKLSEPSRMGPPKMLVQGEGQKSVFRGNK